MYSYRRLINCFPLTIQSPGDFPMTTAIDRGLSQRKHLFGSSAISRLTPRGFRKLVGKPKMDGLQWSILQSLSKMIQNGWLILWIPPLSGNLYYIWSCLPRNRTPLVGPTSHHSWLKLVVTTGFYFPAFWWTWVWWCCRSFLCSQVSYKLQLREAFKTSARWGCCEICGDDLPWTRNPVLSQPVEFEPLRDE